MNSRLGSLAVLLLFLGAHSPARPPDQSEMVAAAPRRPIALAVHPDGKLLFVANRAGTVSVLDVEKRRVRAEAPVGRRLADLTVTRTGQMLTVDEESHELVILASREEKLSIEQRVSVARWPVSVRASADGSFAVVASLWSRSLSVVELTPKPRVARTIALPFAPRQQLFVPGDERLLVTDAFGGWLAVVDVRQGKVESARELPGHNIRGLALSAEGKHVLLTHQILYPQAETTRDEVHWGNVLTNNVRSLVLADVLDPTADLLRTARLYSLGGVNRGAADPAGLTVLAGGDVVVTLAGVDEIALGAGEVGRDRVAVGRRPVAVAASADGRTAWVANTFGDSISIVDVGSRKKVDDISLGRAAVPSSVDEGERLFHDARLSHDGWFSCQSCHPDGHTNGKLSDTQGDGSFGAPKRVLSLRGLKDSAPYGWLGRFDDLDAQIRHSVRTTMHGPKLSDEQVRSLRVYLESLPLPPPRIPAANEAVKRGQKVFEEQNCAACHTAPSFTSGKVYDVGLPDEVGNRKFNPPSLRGVSQGGPWFHDGRAATLEDIFTRHRHQLKVELSRQQLDDLVSYLGSL